MEIKPHPYWESYGAYENGSVVGRSGKTIKPILHHTGYAVMTLRQDGVQKQVRWHRFVWECVRGPIPENMVINHINGDKLDNRISNLEVVTQSENSSHAFQTGLRSGKSGAENAQAKLTEEEAVELISNLHLSNKVLGEKYGLHPNYVSLIRHKKRWRSLWDKLTN